MNKARWVSAAAGTAVLVAGLALPAGAAFADGPSGDGNSGVLSVLSGNDVNAPVSLPVDVCGVAVSLLGGAIGAALAWLFFNGHTVSTLGAAFAQVVFQLTVTHALIITGIIWACIIGLLGGFFPALRAARLPVAEALRAG